MELRRIEYDSTNDELRPYETSFPAGWDEAAIEAANTEYQLTDNFDAITSALIGTSEFPASQWGTQITNWQRSLDQADPQQAALVNYRLTRVQSPTVVTIAAA